MKRRRLATAWGLAAFGYAAGLVVSTETDLPTGAVIVWALVVVGLAWYWAAGRRQEKGKGHG